MKALAFARAPAGRILPLSALSQRRCSSESSEVRIPLSEARPFIERVLQSVGSKKTHAEIVADNLFAADYRGHYSHGIQRLDYYVLELKSGTTSATNEPRIEREHGAITLVDGCRVLGAPVGHFCMQVALEKAKKFGIAFVSARQSNHFGICAFYTLRALQLGFIGLCSTNSSPIMQVTRGRYASLGTLPLSVAAPADRTRTAVEEAQSKKLAAAPWRRGIVDEHPDDLVLDMASTAVAFGKIEMAAKRGDPQIPSGWVTNSHGDPTTNPQEGVLGYLHPLGGDELHSSYKGYGLALALEALCGVLADAAYGPLIRNWKKLEKESNLAHFFIAIDPSVFRSGFSNRLSNLVNLTRSVEPLESSKPVLIPGDPERQHMRKCDEQGFIVYHANVIAIIDKLADQLGVERIKRV